MCFLSWFWVGVEQDPRSLAKVVTTFIRESESALHEGLEGMYEKMGDVTLRWV